MALCINEVAVYIHICPGSYNVQYVWREAQLSSGSSMQSERVFGGQHASKTDVAAIEALQLNGWNMNGGVLFKR